MLLRAGTVLDDRYEILSTVGTGGMADVYRARDNVLKRLVAVKVLKEEFSSDAGFVAKFRQEAQSVSALNHPNIVGVYDVGEQGGMYFIVMELVEGINLKKYIEKTGAMDEREAVEVAMQVAKGLEAAHDQGIIHRDIKPQNIIISREGKIKVADFGIARMVATETATTSTMGSVHYISPEQARGGACDARSDIYSLGVTLYEMVTGQVPYDGESSVAIALKHVQEEIPHPRALTPTLSHNLDRIIVKCMQKNRGFRYQTMSDLLVDFKKLIVMPDEDFVVLPQDGLGEPQMAMRPEDADILKVAGISPAKARWNEEEANQAYEEGVGKAIQMQEEDRIAEEKAKRTEHILTYVMLGIGLLILVTIIAIVFKACALLTPSQRRTTAWTTEAVVTTPRPSAETTVPTTPAPTTETTPEATTETTSDETTIPEGTVLLRDLIGMDYVEAMDALLEDGLRVHLEYEMVEEGDERDDNVVVDQSYDPGVPLLLGTEVTIWIATRDSSTVVIPTIIVGKTVEEASMILREVGLSVSSGTEWENSSTIEKGRVIGASPSVGALADKGTPVTLILSNGPAMFKLPPILGYTKEQAESALYAAGFAANTNLRVRPEAVASTTYLPDTVAMIEASINGETRVVSPGEFLDLRSVIYITMTESAPVLPDLLGRDDLEGAIIELQRMGLAVALSYDASETFPVGQICWVTEKDGKTDIAEGTVLTKGDIVMLHISAKLVPQGLVGMTVAEAVALLDEEEIEHTFEGDVIPSDMTKMVVTAVSPEEGMPLEGEEAVVTISYEDIPETTEATTEAPTTTPAPTTAPTTEAPTTTPEPTTTTAEVTFVTLGVSYIGEIYTEDIKNQIEQKGLTVDIKERESDAFETGAILYVEYDMNNQTGEATADQPIAVGSKIIIYVRSN